MCGAGEPTLLTRCRSKPICFVQRDVNLYGREVEVIAHGILSFINHRKE